MDDAHARWLVLLLLGVLLLPTALYGWRSAPQAAMNRHFAMQTLVVEWWVIGIAATHSSYAAEFWGRWAFAAAALMPAAFLSFAEVFPTPGQPFPTVFARSIRVFAAVFATTAVATPWIAGNFVVTAGVLTRAPGPLMPVFSLYFLTSAAFIFLLLARKWRAARGLERAQLRLYFLGLSLFCVGAITTNLLLPSIVGDSRYSTLGPAFVPVFLAFVAHGIIRHRLMNVRLVAHNWLTACIASLVSIIPLSFVASRLEPLANPTSTTSRFSSMVPLLLAGLLAPPLWIKTRDLLHRYVYRGNADFRLRISEASDRLSQVLAQKETATVIIDTVFAAVRPEGVAVYVDGGNREGLNLLQSRQTHSSFATPCTLPEQVVSELKEWRLLASFQSVPAEASAPPSGATAEILEKNHWALIIPFVTEAQLIGAVAVGGKLSGDPYFLEDVGLLQVLGSQATAALKNGQLYERVLLANQHIANIVATIQSGIIVVYDRQTVRIMNDAAVRLLGLPQTLSVPAVVSTGQLPAALVSILDETRESCSATQTVELIISGPDGALPIVCSTSLLRRPDGYIVGVVAALGDLSTLKALEVERGRAERLNYFETLAAALAHEIGNPIAPIKLMTQLLPARFHSEVFIHDFTRTVSREISRIEKLVERLRRLSRPAHRERVAVDLRTALRDAIDLVQPVLDERRINLVTSISARPLVICGDPSELQELFLNLLTNAVEATPDAGQIAVEATCESSDALVRFSDSGLGIASDIVDRIFEPFVSSKHRGSGLGLTICSGVIERHRGSIAACNTGTGAMFTVRIPLAPEAAASSEESRS